MSNRLFQYGKDVLITGASKGIGLEATRLFADNGFNVWALSRHRGPKIDHVVWLEADVTDSKSLKSALSDISNLGIVIHCAGMGISGSAELISDEAAKRQMEVNYFGVLNVNRIILEKLRRNPKSLVLITSSIAGIIPIPYQSHYSSSKYALEAYGEALAMEGKQFGLRVCIVEPGDTKTSFTSSRTHDEPMDSPYLSSYTKAVTKMEKDEQTGKDPTAVAKVFLSQVARKKPKVRIAVGLTYKFFSFVSKVLPNHIRQFILRKMY